MSQYFDSDPKAPSDRRTIACRIYGRNFEFVTDTNVFSRDSVDKGTELLLDCVIKDMKSMQLPKDDRILDLGCGYGVAGVVLKSVFMKCDTVSVDVNPRAVGLARENYALNNVKPYLCTESNVLASVPSDLLFDQVVTNPPVRAGKSVVFDFYTQAYSRMKTGGCLYSVLQRKQGAPSSEKKLTELFGNCETLGISGGYRVMKAVKE